MAFLPYLAPFFLIFEAWQLVMSERYLGIARIEQGVDPRKLPLGGALATVWTVTMVASWLWIVLLLLEPVSRAPGVCMLLVTGCGYFLRRSSPMKWVLVILTFEGACRIGMMFYLTGTLWNQGG